MSSLGVPLHMLFAAVLMLGVLVTVHEFGHFLVAKLCGVRVLKFSIGFGAPIGLGRFRMAWHHRGTDYVVAWIPLGGFVKMLGEVPGEVEHGLAEEDRAHSLGAQPTWKKLAIIFAGPAMNLLLPVVVLTGSLWVGMDRPEAVVGTVEPGSPAAMAGLLPGDRIVTLDGKPLRWWDQLDRSVREHPGQVWRLVVERGAQRLERVLTAARRPGLDVFQQQREIGWLGLQHARQMPVLGVLSLDSPAARAGLRSGDRVTEVAGQKVEDWTGLAAAYTGAKGPRVAFRVVRKTAHGKGDSSQQLTVPTLGSLSRLGVIPAVVLVSSVSPGMPAEAAGLAPGDLIIAVDGEPIGSFFTFQETVAASGGSALKIQVARAGETRVVSMRPKQTEIDGQERYLIGIVSRVAMLPGVLGIDQVRNPLRAVPRATGMTLDLTRVFLTGLSKIVTGKISRRAVGGPIEIVRQSNRALEAGFETFLRLMTLISINLGILNLLPIPVLDGGQALMFLIEGVKRGPLSMRTREFVQQVGLVLIVALMGLAFWNDFSRNWSDFLAWLRGL